MKKGTCTATGELVAVKVIDKRRAQMNALSQDVDEMIRGEVKILKGLKHPCVLGWVGRG